jgi:hypothetical protein
MLQNATKPPAWRPKSFNSCNTMSRIAILQKKQVITCQHAPRGIFVTATGYLSLAWTEPYLHVNEMTFSGQVHRIRSRITAHRPLLLVRQTSFALALCSGRAYSTVISNANLRYITFLESESALVPMNGCLLKTSKTSYGWQPWVRLSPREERDQLGTEASWWTWRSERATQDKRGRCHLLLIKCDKSVSCASERVR